MSAEDMKLDIGEEVRELLESRGMRTEDVAVVIGNAEQTGEKLYRDDRYLAQLRIGEVTFYVEYSVDDAGGYRVHTGYAHKALILDE